MDHLTHRSVVVASAEVGADTTTSNINTNTSNGSSPKTTTTRKLLNTRRNVAKKGGGWWWSPLSFLFFGGSNNNKTKIRKKTVKKKISSSKKNSSNNSGITLDLWSSRGLLVIVAAVYSTNFASMKYLETVCFHPPCTIEHDPSEAAFCRFLISALVCIPILYHNFFDNNSDYETTMTTKLPLIYAGIEVGCWMTVNYICQAEALEYIPAGKCSFIAAMAVALVPIMAGIFQKKPIHLLSMISAAIALMGVGIIEDFIPLFGGGSAVHSASHDNSFLFLGMGKGDWLALGQPIGFGYGMMRISYYIEKYAHIPNRVLIITAVQCIMCCMCLLGWVVFDSIFVNHNFPPDLRYMFLEPHRFIALCWTGIFTTVLNIILQGIALQKASATDASLIFSTEPLMGSLFAGWLLNEQLTTATYIGGAFILAACILGSFSSSSESNSTNKNLNHHLKNGSSNSNNNLVLPLTNNNNNIL